MTKSKDAVKNETLSEEYKSNRRSSWAEQVIDGRAFMAGAMWKTADKKKNDARGQISPITNELIPTINSVVAQLVENDPRFTAIGRERSDTKTASDIADLMAYIWYISDGRSENLEFTQDFEVDGLGTWMAYTDPYGDSGKGEIMICCLDPLEVYIDPNSKKAVASDASNILIVKSLTKEQIQTNYPDFDITQAQASFEDDYPSHNRDEPQDQTIHVEDQFETKYKLIDRYTKVKIKRFHVYDALSGFEKTFRKEEYVEWAQKPAVILTKLGQETYTFNDKEIEELSGIIQKFGNVQHFEMNPQTQQPEIVSGVEVPQQLNPLSIPNSTQKLFISTRGDLIREGKVQLSQPYANRIKRVFTIGGAEYANYIMENEKGALEDYPIVTSMLHHFRNPYPMSDVQLAKSLQEQLNKIDNLIITYNQNITNVKLFVQKGGGLKKELEKTGAVAGQQVYEMDMDVDKVPFVIQLTQMSSALYQQRQNLIQQIQRVIGSYAFQDGESSQAPQTKGGTILLDEMMQRRTAFKKKKIESGMNQLAKVISQMIPMTYTEQKIIRILKPNHRGIKEIMYNQPQINDNGELEILNDLSVDRYDIQVISGSMLPTNKMQRREEKLRLYELGLLKDPEWYLRDMDEPDVDEILQRESLINQAQAQIQQLEQKVKELTGDLQTAQRESLQSKMQSKVAGFNAELKGTSSEIKSKAQLAIMRMGDEVKKKKSVKESA